MSRSQKVIAGVMTVLSGIAMFGFFAFFYPYHLHFQEQYQLFESTWAYFASVASVPGGLADWTGRFLTQFCYYARVGAALLAMLLCAVQLLTWAVCRNRSLLIYALTFVPAFVSVAYFCDENALAGGLVALALSLGAAALCQLIRNVRTKRILVLCLVPVLYMACGPLSLVFGLTLVILELSEAGGQSHRVPFSATGATDRSVAKRWLFVMIIILLTILSPLVASRIFPYTFERLLLGVHYYRSHNILPGLLYTAALSSVLVVLISCLKVRKPLKSVVPGLVLYAALVTGGVFLTLRTADFFKEEWMHYDFMVRMQMWNRILFQADRRRPDNPKTVSCLNLALAKTGRLPENQFSFYQNGPDGLLPSYEGDYTNPVSTGEIFWHLGMVNTAQRYAFEAQEAIPDFQKSGRFYQRLAETNIVNGDWDVARKYLKALQHACFYRKWANETLALLEDSTVFERRPDLARARDWRLNEHDFLFSEEEMDSMLGMLSVEHPENTLALDYLLAWCLLRKDLNRFAECLTMVKTAPLPQAYQEAMVLLWSFTHEDYSGLPAYINPVNVQGLNRFIADANSGKTMAMMEAMYGKTYWFYFLYRYNRTE